MADSDKDENGDFVAQAFSENSPVSAGGDAEMASDEEGDGERAGLSVPIEWSEDETAQGGSGDVGVEEGDELDGLPVFGVDQDPWDTDVPPMVEPYPETSNTGSDSRMTGLEEEQEHQGQQDLDEGSEKDNHSEEGLTHHTGLSPMTGDEGLIGSVEATNPEERTEADKTSSPPPSPPAEPAPEEDQHQSESPETHSQTEDAASLQAPSPHPSTSGMEPSGAEDPELFPSLPLLNIKDEPIDEGYNAALQPQPPVSRIKEELDQLEEFGTSSSTEQIRISAVFSVGGSSNNSAAPPVPLPQASMLAPPRVAPAPLFVPALGPAPAPPPLPPLQPTAILIRCSGCSKVLQRGQTAFQRKGSNQLFCSTPCLTGASLPPAGQPPLLPQPPPPPPPAQVIRPPPPPSTAPTGAQYPVPPHSVQPQRKKFCSNCHKEIVNLKDLIKAPVGHFMRDFCSQSCMENINKKVPLTPYKAVPGRSDMEISKCSMCQKMAIGTVTKSLDREVDQLAHLSRLLAERTAQLADREAKLAEAAAQIAERDAKLAEAAAQLAERDAEIQRLKSTDSAHLPPLALSATFNNSIHVPPQHTDVTLRAVGPEDHARIAQQSRGQVGTYGRLLFRASISEEQYRAWCKTTNWDGSRGKQELPHNLKTFVLSTLKRKFPAMGRSEQKDCIDRINEYLRKPRR